MTPARPTALTMASSHTIDAEASAVVDLDAAIAKRRDELAVLERAKDIVLGG